MTFAEEEVILDMMDTEMLAPAVLGEGAYSDGDLVQALVIGFNDPDTPLDTDIDLSDSAVGEAPLVGVGYDVNLLTQKPTASFTSTAGTLHLTRRCEAGVAGSISDVSLVEIDQSTDPDTVIDGGCTLTIPSLTFDFGDACQ